MVSTDASHRRKVLIAMEPLEGGTLTHLDHIVQCVPLSDFEVHLAVSLERDPSVRTRVDGWRERGVRVHEIPMVRSLNPLADARAFWRLWHLCRREKFDIIHTHSAKAGFLGRLVGRLCRTPVVHTAHVFPFDRWPGEVSFLLLERLAARWTARFIVLSHYQANLVERYRLAPPDRVIRVPNAFVERSQTVRDRAEARTLLDLAPQMPVVLAIGRVCRQKGSKVFLEAASRLSLAGASVHMVLVGDGPILEELRSEVATRGLEGIVSVLGYVDNPQCWYAACDLVVLPSRYEGLPYSVLEARAAARPVALSLVSGMEEFVRHGQDGWLFPPEDPDALASLLSGLSKRRDELDRMGEAGRASMDEEWGLAAFKKRLCAIYSSL